MTAHASGYHAPTESIERAVIDGVWPVRAVTFRPVNPDRPALWIGHLVLPWWAWLAGSYLHFRALRLARPIVDRTKTDGTLIMLELWA